MKTIAILAIASAAAAPAFAGGPVMTAPEPVIATPVTVYAPSANWTGFYAGAHLGYGRGIAKVDGSGFAGNGNDNDGENDGNNFANAGGFRDHGNGFIGGIDGGYRYDFGQFVLGGELSYTDSNADFGASGKFRDTTDLKLVAGYDVGKTLIYGTVGPSYGRAKLDGIGFKDNGYVFGLGMDYAVTDRITVGGELLHRQYNNFDGTGVDVSGTSIEAKVGYRF